MAEDPLITNEIAFKRGIACKCPRCGEGKLFSGILKPAPHCAACGLDYNFFDVGDGGATLVIFIAGFLVTGAALYAHIVLLWPIWAHLLVWPIVTVALSLALLRPLKGCLITFQYAYKAQEGQREL